MQEPYSLSKKIQGLPQSWTVFPSKTNKAAIAVVNKSLKPAIIARKTNSPDAPPTFERNIFKGWPDLAKSAQDIISKFANWKVSDEPSLSDHKYINVKIEPQIQNRTYNIFKTFYGNHRKFPNKLKPSINLLLEEIRNSQTQDDINRTTSHIQNKIIDDCKSIYKIKKKEVLRLPSWYTSKLKIEKNRVKELRRRVHRAPQDQRRRIFLTLKKDQALYMRHVIQAKNSGWRKFSRNVSNPFGKQYKAVFRKTIPPTHLIALKNNTPTGDQLKIAENILEQMFPIPLDYADLSSIRTNTPDDAPFTKEEIAIVIKKLHKGKAPGPDGIDNIIIQQINESFLFLFMELFNKCLHLWTFPDPLKLGNIILFKKEGKPEDEASVYRLISLLPTIGKDLPKLLTQGLNYHLLRLNKIIDNQYVFRDDVASNSPSHSKNQ
ncbi:hypothetical protein AVEN_79827-1 [Araneus ventricosus]|uniref:RNA-directed DNA polymerase from transposon X-element n=1 Tax=Araneus ventricosus TaxID=182803 RepID=A0A4Y2EXF8_ARAVE|nr:hypothetical protein AVEN_79827-1 [Araneus ventricosus]